MRLDRYRRAPDFLADAGPWLAEREAEHNLILGIAGAIARAGPDDAAVPYFALVRDGDRKVAAAMRTPPWNLVLSEVDDLAALPLLADDLAGESLPGVTGPPHASRRFGEIWTEACGGSARTIRDERIYQVTAVKMPPRPGGDARLATIGDRPLILEWVTAFHAEALPEEEPPRSFEDWDPSTGRSFWIWDVGGTPVSLVGVGSPTPSGVRVGPVYTPPANRGRGYASALTAVASQHALDSGRRFCFLYTDLANPTANRIYQAIGYERVTDALMVRFTAG